MSARVETLRARLAALPPVDESGPGGVDAATSAQAYAALAGRCFNATIEPYVYSMCPFGAAKQDPGGVSLGHNKGLGDTLQAGQPVLLFEGGAGCWNGPARSLRVELACGAKDALSRVEEPNRCAYEARFETPAACSAAEAEKLAAAADAANKAAAAALAARAPTHTEL